MSKHDQPGPPCSHMKKMLNDTADGRARGLRLWFTLQHVLHCGRCRRYLDCLKAMVASLRGKSKEDIPDEVENRLMAMVAKAKNEIVE